MQDWNRALLAACDRYPNMRIYDWASDVKDSWFIDDGIHFTTPGYAARGRLIADALAEAFPAGEPTAPTDQRRLRDPPQRRPRHHLRVAERDRERRGHGIAPGPRRRGLGR